MANSGKLKGLVLCGGESKRMGSDKGLHRHNDQVWAQIVSTVIKSIGIDVHLSVRKEQVGAYQKYFHTDQLIIDNELLLTGGPMTGLLSAHEKFPDDDWLVLACDMISIHRAMLLGLIKAYTFENNYNFFIVENPENEHRFEPLCAIYKANGLSRISINTNNIHDFSLINSVLFDNCYILRIAHDAGKFIRNYNTEEEYKQYQTPDLFQ